MPSGEDASRVPSTGSDIQARNPPPLRSWPSIRTNRPKPGSSDKVSKNTTASRSWEHRSGDAGTWKPRSRHPKCSEDRVGTSTERFVARKDREARIASSNHHRLHRPGAIGKSRRPTSHSGGSARSRFCRSLANRKAGDDTRLSAQLHSDGDRFCRTSETHRNPTEWALPFQG